MGLVTAGYSLATCADKQSNGGVQTLWIINTSELDPSSCVFAAGTGYTTIALDSAKTAYQLTLKGIRQNTAKNFKRGKTNTGQAFGCMSWN